VTSATYEPRPGSVPARVIAHLQTLPYGAERLSSQIAEAVKAPPAHVTACLEGAVTAGAIFRRKKDSHVRAPIYWSLVDHTKANGNAPAPATQSEVAKKTPPEGANRDASAGQSHGAGGPESPAGRGTDGAPALGAAPVFPMRASRAEPASDGSQKPNGAWHDSSTATARAGSDTPTQGPQHVLKAEAARPDATDRGAPANASPVGGPTGAGQAAAAAPTRVEKPEALRGKNAAWWMTGELAVEAEDGTVIVFDSLLAAKLVGFLCAHGRGAAC
jgi:hypothetical protein